MKYFIRILLCFGMLLTVGSTLAAAIEDLSFPNQQEHDRYQKLIAELRCPKCLNVNLAGSDAPIAADLRAEIFEQITAGRSDEEIISFLTDRYGDFILYRPPLNPGTVLLWFGPPLLLLGGFYITRRMLAASAATTSSEILDADEQQKLANLLINKKDQA